LTDDHVTSGLAFLKKHLTGLQSDNIRIWPPSLNTFLNPVIGRWPIDPLFGPNNQSGLQLREDDPRRSGAKQDQTC
jgi:hypothetical protein